MGNEYLPLFEDVDREILNHFSPDARTVLSHGDVNDLLDTIPDETIKLIVTSPPYNIGKVYETKVGIEQYLEQQSETIKRLYLETIFWPV